MGDAITAPTTIWVVGHPGDGWCAEVFAHLAPIANRATLRLVPSLDQVPPGAWTITHSGRERDGVLGAADVLAVPPERLTDPVMGQTRASRGEGCRIVSVLATDPLLGAEVALLIAESCSYLAPTTLLEARTRGLQGFLHDLVDPRITVDSLAASAAALGLSDAESAAGVVIPSRGYRLLPRARGPLGAGPIGSDAVAGLLSAIADGPGSAVADLELPGPSSVASGLLDADELFALPRALLATSTAAVVVGRATLVGHFGFVNLVTDVLADLPPTAPLYGLIAGPTRRGESRRLERLLDEVIPGATHRMAGLIAMAEPDLDTIHRAVGELPSSLLASVRPLTEALALLEPAPVGISAKPIDYPIYETLDALVPGSAPPGGSR